jgi:hypothetical protein
MAEHTEQGVSRLPSEPKPRVASPSELIITEQEELARQYLRQRQEAAAEDRARAELNGAWDAVAYWLAPDGSVVCSVTGAEAPPAAAVPAIARLNKTLTARGLLGNLAKPPAGVEGEDLQAWRLAEDILRSAPDKPEEARRLLGRMRGLPFAPRVRDWLCRGFRIVVEGRWQTGPLCVEMMRPLNPLTVPPQSAGVSRQDAAERLAWQREGDPPAHVRPLPPNAVESLLGAEAREVLEVARSDRSADAKIRAICRIDLRYLAYKSNQWADLLGTSAAAIRKTTFWKEDRQRAIEADRELRGE